MSYNKQGFEFSSDKLDDDAREQDLADALELVANNLWLYTVNIEYPKGWIELKGF